MYTTRIIGRFAAFTCVVYMYKRGHEVASYVRVYDIGKGLEEAFMYVIYTYI